MDSIAPILYLGLHDTIAAAGYPRSRPGCGDDGGGAMQLLQPTLCVRKGEFRTVWATHVVAVVERFFDGPEGHAVLSRHRALFCSLQDGTFR